MSSRATCPPGCGCRKHAPRCRPRSPWPQWRLAPCGTSAAYRRHRRRGEPACPACLEAERLRNSDRYGWEVTALTPDRREVRNGIPWKPYVYRGLGFDQLTGEGNDQCA